MKVLGIREIPVSKIEVIQGLLPRVETHTVEDKVEEYREAMEIGSEFPPITVWQKGDEFWLIDGMHRLMASKRLGRETIKAEIVELKDMLEAEILAITKNRHGLPLTKEEKRLLCQNLYSKNVKIQELQKIFGVSERTIYNWVQGLKRREKPKDIKEKALEMRRQGYTQEEVARELGVSKMAISNWERESKEPAKIADCLQTPTPSEEEPDFYDDIEEEDEISYEKIMQVVSNPEISKQMVEYARQKWKEEEEKEKQKRSNGGRPPNDPPPATEEELYESLKADLTLHMNQIALKIGWAKALPMFEEVLEEMRELSKIAKRGW
jgi:ParB-like chromosome segregation protein Spo0J